MGVEALIEQFKTIPDWRRARQVHYPLWFLLLLSLLGVMSGYSSLRGLSDFMQRHHAQVCEQLGLVPSQAPSYNTIWRLVHRVPGHRVVAVFHHWAQATLSVPEGVGIAIDGKALASTVQNTTSAQQDFVSVVSACVQGFGWVIGHECFQNGQCSEIERVRQLLDHLDVKGAWFTLDALHCQKKTVTLIVATHNHYCIGLKGNQPKLLQQAQACAHHQHALSQDYQLLDTSRGRCIERRIEVFAAPPSLTAEWPALAAFVRVERLGIRDEQVFQRYSWFILSQVIPAKHAAALIQGHRGTVENQLHWVKDVVQQEDNSLIQAARPAHLMALLRSWAISAFRKAGHHSITRAVRLFGHDLPKLFSFL